MPTPPSTPATLLAQAELQLQRLLSGSKAVEVDTPGIGRVVYQQTSIAELQKLIDSLRVQAGVARSRRRPISVEAWP